MTSAPETVELLSGELDAEYAGVGMRGLLFRSPRRRRYHRVILNDQLNAAQRSELGAWRHRPRRAGLAPIVQGDQGDQREVGGRWFQIVTYETAAEGNLAERIAAEDPRRRLRAIEGVLRSLPDWWKGIGHGVLPTPADIVFDRGVPVLLPLPPWGVPPIGEFLSERERVLHLSPDTARGIRGPGRADDLFTLAIAALRCIDDLPEEEPGMMLRMAGCADLSSARRCSSRLPLWMSRTDPVEEVRALLRRLSGPDGRRRSECDPSEVAEAIRSARKAMDPLTALRTLRTEREFRRAVDLAHAVLLDDPDYEVMTLAADIASTDLRSPLEALSFLERAVQADPDRTDAYKAQLSLVFEPATSVLSGFHAAVDASFSRRLDQTVKVAFDRLPQRERQERAHDMAAHLLRRGELAEANVFAHQWLHNGPTLKWWEFDLMLDYGESFRLLGMEEPAEQVAAQVKQGLRRVRENGQMSQREIHRHGMRLAAFEVALRSGRDRGERGR